MAMGPATEQYCKQLPGADLYNQAGARFKAGDHAGAAKILTSAAQAGNAPAQLRLAMMYEKGDGWGSPTVIECRGCSYGCVYNARSFASNYHGIRRSGF